MQNLSKSHITWLMTLQMLIPWLNISDIAFHNIMVVTLLTFIVAYPLIQVGVLILVVEVQSHLGTLRCYGGELYLTAVVYINTFEILAFISVDQPSTQNQKR